MYLSWHLVSCSLLTYLNLRLPAATWSIPELSDIIAFSHTELHCCLPSRRLWLLHLHACIKARWTLKRIIYYLVSFALNTRNSLSIWVPYVWRIIMYNLDDWSSKILFVCINDWDKIDLAYRVYWDYSYATCFKHLKDGCRMFIRYYATYLGPS